MMRVLLLSVALSGLLAGCVTTYEDDRVTDLNVAVVRFDHPINGGVLIEALDGERPGVRLVREYRLLPGEHSFRARANIGGYRSDSQTHWFDAEPGGRYRIDTAVDREGEAWGFSIIDERTGARVDRNWTRQKTSSVER